MPSKQQDWWQDISSSHLEWQIPEQFNIASACLDHAEPNDPAVVVVAGADVRSHTFAQIRSDSLRLASWMTGRGLQKGDRVAVLLSQGKDLVTAHMAAYFAGLVAVPLTVKFGPDAVRFRLQDSGSRVLFLGSHDVERFRMALAECPELEALVISEGPSATLPGPLPSFPLGDVVAASREQAEPVPTHRDDPALLIYTSGTTGNPKGALHAHRVLAAHMPGVRITHENFPQPGDRMWSPAEWAWIGGLLDVLFPSLGCGIPVVACAEKFSPDLARRMFEELGVRNAFIPPTALKQLRSWGFSLESGHPRTVTSGGESLGDHLQDWARASLGVHVNEFYGQTEMNMVVGQNRAAWVPASGSMGRAIPGFQVTVLDAAGEPVPPGETGEICLATPSPGQFLGYWNQPEKTLNKYFGSFLRTGDLGALDSEGNVTFKGRVDDVISSGGYRIGPGEIEETLMSHPAVALAAVVGKPDALRGEVVAAYIVPRDGVETGEELRSALQNHVKHQLAFYQYPRIIEFRAELPMTPTGKIQRRLLR